MSADSLLHLFSAVASSPGASQRPIVSGAACGRVDAMRAHVRPLSMRERVVFPPKRDSYAPRHEQSELLLAAAGALRSPLRRIASDVLLAACRDLGWAFGPGRTTRPDCQVPPTAAKKKGRLGRRPFKIVPLRRYGCFS